MARKPKAPKKVETLTHDEASRKNIPTAEMSSTAERLEEMDPFPPVTYPRALPLAEGEERERDGDLDPQIVWKGATLRLNPEQIEQLTATGKLEIGEAELTWRGKDTQDWSDLVVQAPPLYIQEKVHPKAIVEDLKRQTEKRTKEQTDAPDMFDMFGDFNGIDEEANTEFYQHDQNWQNRMILGDSLQVMASLAEREGLRGKVQCIYFDPPYGIKFNSNWQVSTRSTKVSDGKLDQITREPEQVKAFRDTWTDGIHSYLTYLRDRLTGMRDLLADSGSIFVQIGDENVHRVRALMDEIFGETNFCSLITYKTSVGLGSQGLDNTANYIVWFSKNKEMRKFRPIIRTTTPGKEGASRYKTARMLDLSEERVPDPANTILPEGARLFRDQGMTSRTASATTLFPVLFKGKTYKPSSGGWRTSEAGYTRAIKADRILQTGRSLSYRKYYDDFAAISLDNVWADVSGGITSRADPKVYVVQTGTNIVQRCVLMTTDPGDIVFDPTCGSGTTAMVSEQWGRRWITVDTSRVALALARTRLMSARYPYYLLTDSEAGRIVEQEISGRFQPEVQTYDDIRQGFVYERLPHIMLKTITNNAEIDVIWDNYQEKLEPLRQDLNKALKEIWEEWEIPRVAGEDWSDAAKAAHAKWREHRIARQREIDKSIAQKADVEMLYDRPYEDKSKVRVAGPFTVESLSPHRVMPADEADELVGLADAAESKRARKQTPFDDFTAMILENLKTAGVHQASKEDRIAFNTIDGWPGEYIAAEGHFQDGTSEKRAAIFIGPEFGTVTRADITAAAREANESRFDALIVCGFNFDAHASDLTKMGPLPILKAKMNQDLHMSDELKNTGKGNLFTIIGEPDIEWNFDDDGNIIVEVLGLDVFDLKTSEVRSSEKDDIAAWFIDTDYNEESFFVRHAYFLGANDPYKALKASLKAEIDKEAWETLYRDKSRPFPKPVSGRFAVKVINHFGDEVMKIFEV
jgi:adenine-specific DNA-methyltransferase